MQAAKAAHEQQVSELQKQAQEVAKSETDLEAT